jgi:hypothetical protein
MGDPLKFDTVTPMPKDDSPDPPAEDPRPFWKRLFSSIRPTASLETDKKTGKRIETVGIGGHSDF